MKLLKQPAVGFALALILLVVLTNFGPVERSLGVNVRLVYLHGVWVWTAIMALAGSALFAIPGAFMDNAFSGEGC